MAQLIGICGKAGSGKSTAGHWFATQHGLSQYAFADPLKDGIVAMLGVPRAWMEDQEAKKNVIHPYGVTLRHLLQSLGTEWGRALVHADVWLMRAAQVIADNGDPGTVVTDVRFENEADFIRDKGGLLVHIVRNRAGLAGDTGQHASEAGIEINEDDLVVHNTGSVEDFHAELGRWFPVRN